MYSIISTWRLCVRSILLEVKKKYTIQGPDHTHMSLHWTVENQPEAPKFCSHNCFQLIACLWIDFDVKCPVLWFFMGLQLTLGWYQRTWSLFKPQAPEFLSFSRLISHIFSKLYPYFIEKFYRYYKVGVDFSIYDL